MKNDPKLIFTANFRKLQKKLPICKNKYAEILRTGGAIFKKTYFFPKVRYFSRKVTEK